MADNLNSEPSLLQTLIDNSIYGLAKRSGQYIADRASLPLDQLLQALQRDIGGIEDAQRGFGQLTAGAAETVLGAPGAEGLEMAVPSGIWALTGLLGSDRGNELFAAATQQADKIGTAVSGVPIVDPSITGNDADLINRIGGGALLPGPSIPVKAAGPLVRTVVEGIMPLNQTRSVGGVVAGTAAPYGAVQGIEALADVAATDSVHDPLGLSPGEPQDLLGLSSPVPTTPTPPSRMERLVDGTEDRSSTVDLLGLGEPEIALPDNAFDPLGLSTVDDEESISTPLAIAAGAATLALSVLAYKRHIQGRGLKPTELTGQRPQDPQVTSSATKAEGLVLNRFAPLEDAMGKADPTAHTDFIADVRTTITPGALSARVTDFFKTGQLPNSALRTTKLATHLQALSKLSSDQLDMYDDTLLALTQLDDMRIHGRSVWGSKTLQELQSIVARGAQDPVVTRMIGDAHNYYRGLRDYMHEAGVISDATRNKWAAEQPNYVPTRLDFGDAERGILDILDPEEARDIIDGGAFLRKREGLAEPGQVQRPSVLMQSYGDSVIRLAERNRLRRSFLEKMVNTQYGQGFVTRVAPNASAENTIAVLENGKTVRYKVTDNAIRHALEFAPTYVVPIMNSMRSLFQNFTTGLARPDFLPVSWAYEVQSTMALQRRGEGIGVLDELTGGRVSKYAGTDPSVFLAPITGTARSAYADMMYALGRNMETQLLTGGAVRRLLGMQNTQRLADIGMRAYENSARRVFEQYGGGNAVFSGVREFKDVATSLQEIAPSFSAKMMGAGLSRQMANRLWLGYSHMFTQMHNAVRIQHLAANTSYGRGLTARAKQNAAAGARASAGDVTLTGSSPVTTGYLSTVPYANVSIQIMAAHAAALKRNPARYLAATAGVSMAGAGLLYSQFVDNPAAQDHYWNGLTADQRAQFIPFYDSEGNVIARLPIEHQLRLTWSPFIEMLGVVSGSKYGMVPDAQTMADGFAQVLDNGLGQRDAMDVRSGMQTAVSGVLFNPLPPAASAMFPAMGVEAPDVGRFSQGQAGVGPLRTERITSDPSSKVARGPISAQFEAVLAELLGSSARPVVDSVDAFHRNVVRDNPNFMESVSDLSARELEVAMEAAGRRFAAPFQDRFPVVYGTEMQQRLLINNADAKLVKNKMDALREISDRFRLDLFNPGGATKNYGGTTGAPLPTQVPPEVRGTALADVLAIAGTTAQEYTQNYGAYVQRKFRELEDARANVLTASSPTLLRERENEIVKEIRKYQQQAMEYIATQEGFVTEMLRDKYGVEDADFTFDDFDPEELMQMRLPIETYLPPGVGGGGGGAAPIR